MGGGPLFIIGADRKWEEERLREEGDSAGFAAQILLAADLTISLCGHETDIFLGGESTRNALKSGRIIFRRTRGAREKMAALAILAEHWNIPATDTPLSITSNLDKMMSMPAMTLRHIRHIKTVFMEQGTTVDLQGHGLSFPLLSKPSTGRHGEGVEVFKTVEHLQNFLANDCGNFLLQELLPIDEEFRVFVLGNEVLGVIRKIPKEGSRIANYAAGATFLPAEVPQEIEREAVEICRHQGISIGGVDLARVGETFYLLEVNRCPEFRAFSDATGINVAEKIIAFIASE